MVCFNQDRLGAKHVPRHVAVRKALVRCVPLLHPCNAHLEQQSLQQQLPSPRSNALHKGLQGRELTDFSTEPRRMATGRPLKEGFTDPGVLGNAARVRQSKKLPWLPVDCGIVATMQKGSRQQQAASHSSRFLRAGFHPVSDAVMTRLGSHQQQPSSLSSQQRCVVLLH